MIFNQNLPTGRYSALDPGSLLATLATLRRRVGERFPESGLNQVAAELDEVAQGVVALAGRLQKPVWPVRIFTVLAIAGLLAVAGGIAGMSFQLSHGVNALTDFLQAAESALNELIFLALAIFFFTTLETRYKRRLALRSLHRLRSIAHVVDMHQLTKDPAYLLAESAPTSASPKRPMTAYELTRYLDYCSELLALTSKLAALHAQDFQDEPVLATVNEIESLAQGLSGKIWQKIMILDMKGG